MEQRLQTIENCGLCLLRKIQLGRWEEQLAAQEDALDQLEMDLTLRDTEASRWKDPGFFLRLLDPSGKKQETALTRLREANNAFASAKWELSQFQQEIAQATEEYSRLSPLEGSLTPLLPLQTSEYSYFLPAALEAAGWCIDALTAARPYVRSDTHSRRIGVGSRRMELLAQAQTAGQYLTDLLGLMPDLSLIPPASLRDPDSHIRAVTSPYGQLDRLNGILEKLYPLRTRLKELV